MTDKEIFYQRIEDEYDDYLEIVDEYDSKELYNEAETIADMKEIYNYLIHDNPIDGEMLEHYMKLKNPLETICKYYQEEKQPIYDYVNPVIWRIAQEKIFDYEVNEKSEDLKKIMEKEYSNDGVIYGNKLKLYAAESLIKGILNNDFCFDEYEAKVLMQFKKPFGVLLDNFKDSKISTFKEQYPGIMSKLMSIDLLTGKYALKKDKILPETKFRHEIMHKIVKTIPEPDYMATSNWLDFYRDIQMNAEEDYDLTQNPYENFAIALDTISYSYSDEIVQAVYDLAKNNNMLLENELVGAADYLSNGGDAEKVYKMAQEGKFDSFDISGEQQGGMKLC